MDTGFDRWCQQVTDRVRFHPDRAGIAAELRDHYEDHKQALLDLGYDEELAAQRSLEAMGDADEVGRGMDRAHSAVWGWLWSFSRLCFRMAVLLSILLLLHPLLDQYGRYENFINRTGCQLFQRGEPEGAVTVEVPHGKVTLAPIGHSAPDFWNFDLRVDRDSPLGYGPDIADLMTVRDDRGEVLRQDSPFETAVFDPDNWFNLWGPDNVGWTTCTYTFHMRLDHRPEWVELSHPAGWSIRVEIPDGEVTGT